MSTDVVQDHPYSGPNLARCLLIMVAFLVGLGLVAIYASSSLKAAQDVGDPFFFFKKQAIAAAIGFTILGAIQFIPFKWIERATLPVMLITVFLLALVFVPGMYVKVKGAERWLNLPFIGGQPAELAKLAMVLFLAKNLSRDSCRVDHFMKGILPNLIVFGLFTIFLLRQRDLGTPVLLFGLTMLMLYVAGLSHKLIGLAGIAGIATVGLAIILEPFRVKRILSFLDPWSQVQDGGFQIIQSFLAFQNGGLLGVGLGESKQKLLFLPEAHTDFILPVIGEELGFLGIALVCAMFFFTAWLSYRIILLQSNPYRKFLAFGITAALTVQTLGNMGVTMGLLPTKGMPLPFISSGRSSLLVSLVMAALLIKLGRDVRKPRTAP